MRKANKGKGKWKATALYCAQTTGRKGSLTPGIDHDMPITVPYMAFLLQDGEQNILIDCGLHERFVVDGKVWGGNPGSGGEKDLIASLAKVGLAPSDIDTVLYTHLHNDHAGNCHLFTHARSFAQRDEWDNLLNPVFAETLRRDYDFEIIPVLRESKNFFKIEGDMELTEGIKLIKTPGHTRGSQCIVANTVNGLRIFTGDLFHCRFNAFPYLTKYVDLHGNVLDITPAPPEYPTIPTAIVYDFYDYYASVDKVRSYCPGPEPEYLVCGHDGAHLHGDI